MVTKLGGVLNVYEWLGSIAHKLYRTIANIDVCIESELVEVKVPLIFLGTVGFSLCREGRYMLFKRLNSVYFNSYMII
jgi:hypothetical protein